MKNQRNSITYYFAYGSNMNFARMRGRKCTWTKKEAATLPEFILRFNLNVGKWAAANIIPKKGAKVEGILYTTDETSLKKLDKYEHVPTHYKRATVTVQLQDGIKVKAITYIASPKHAASFTKKSYLRHLLKGKPFLSKAYYAFLLTTKVVD